MPRTRRPAPAAGPLLRRALPPPALCGFLLLLALVFAAAYVVGTGAGPVAPGMHGSRVSPDGGGADTGGMNIDDIDDMGDMGEGGGH
ncbi:MULTISPECIES: hypothetical protein [Streptomyces]|jgi:hypothetical protein|uniref:Secreted protein n=2 Tax=Streptomyces griseoaurantiacus TaxID=68213 RepID=F3ND53_9ACTN|nr:MULTISPECIES: hypothetical protein [Streptomyces]GHE74631.1 hypothetical protein GCM10018782_55500 [Streptomyces griseoaurantiacus]EGG48636.1 secreted protein [Streptomyces griseoaurantiacus M045]MCF0089097.1 hypothetical protein [Streptomyces sp. MH192]MCF0101199.1 hypothetical protein [Streptomyces sp. MH191]WTI30210.1 hypothetical protein OHA67_29730 [Streptomyces jietaisiensis]